MDCAATSRPQAQVLITQTAAAMRHRRKIGCVGLDEEPIERQLGGDRAERLRALEGNDAGEGHIEAELDPEESEVAAGGEAVQDGGEGPPPRLLAEDRADVGVDDGRQADLPRVERLG